jgi:hypothetical protein
MTGLNRSTDKISVKVRTPDVADIDAADVGL